MGISSYISVSCVQYTLTASADLTAKEILDLDSREAKMEIAIGDVLNECQQLKVFV